MAGEKNPDKSVLTLALGIVSLALCALNFLIPIVNIVGVIVGTVDVALISRFARAQERYSKPGLILAFAGIALGVGLMLYGIVRALI